MLLDTSLCGTDICGELLAALPSPQRPPSCLELHRREGVQPRLNGLFAPTIVLLNLLPGLLHELLMAG